MRIETAGAAPQREEIFRFISALVMIVCVVSLTLPWISFEIKTNYGVINIESMLEESNLWNADLKGISEEDIENIYDAIDSELGDSFIGIFVEKSDFIKQCKNALKPIPAVYSALGDSRVSPLESLPLLFNLGKIMGSCGKIVGYLRRLANIGLADSDDFAPAFEFLGVSGFGGLQTQIEKGTGMLYAVCGVMWGLVLGLAVCVGYNIYALFTHRRTFSWIIVAVYGVLLSAYCIFATYENRIIGAELAVSASIIGMKIHPFHIQIWPVLSFILLIASTVTEKLVNHGAVRTRTAGWKCVCGCVNPMTNTFCKRCGNRYGEVDGAGEETDDYGYSERETAAITWECSCGNTNKETSKFCQWCGRERKPAAAGVKINMHSFLPDERDDASALNAGGSSGVKINMKRTKTIQPAEKKPQDDFRQSNDLD